MKFFLPAKSRRALLLAAQSDQNPLLLIGASGTGKSAIARWVHQQGPRASRPWIEADYKTPLSQALLQAHTGTLVLHDIAERGFADQRELLHLIKTRTLVHRGPEPMRQLLDARIIATSTYPLENRVLGGLFVSELYAKLQGLVVEMPPLTERQGEFEEIAQGVLQEVAREESREYIQGLTPDALATLARHDWPGNIRELRNVLRTAVQQSDSEWIAANHLPELENSRLDFHATRAQFAALYGSSLTPRRLEQGVR